MNVFNAPAGQRVGAYRLMSLLGGGGMGQVYLAERADGQYRQQVAVKLMRQGPERADLQTRFLAERQILASLDHPNLAKLLDGGITDEGVPYFVMELVSGQPIDVYCQSLGLAVEERLRLLRTVCQVVHYAHRQGVVHRDLKPANILVTREGVVKLVDFGIAKQITAPSPHTATLQRVMTLEYASPEQVKGDAVTPASDIFSLGVVLYRLLTGASPYPAATTGSDYELSKAICDTEPLPPSQGVQRPLRRRLKGDLDAVVMMALRKDPAHRYLSAEALADDVFRHLEGLPVQARRGAWSYRAGRFVLRHRAAVGAALVANLALVAGLSFAAYQAYEANRQKARAERHFASVRKLANVFIFDVHDTIENLAGATEARKIVVAGAAQYLQELDRDMGADPSLRLELGAAHAKLGAIHGRAHMANLGDAATARASYAKARTLLAPMTEQRDNLEAWRQATKQLLQIDEFEAALLTSLGQHAEAGRLMQVARQRATELAASRPDDPHNDYRLALQRANHAGLLLASRNYPAYLEMSDSAIAMFERVRQRTPQDRDVLWALAALHNERGLYHMQTGGDAAAGRQALPMLQRSLSLWTSLREAQPEHALFARNVATGHNNLGEALLLAGDGPAADQAFKRALQDTTALAQRDPADTQLRVYQAIVQLNLGRSQLQQRRLPDALARVRTALHDFDALPAAALEESYARSYLALAHYTLAQALRRPSPHEACGHLRSALPLLHRLAADTGIAPGELQPKTVETALAGC